MKLLLADDEKELSNALVAILKHSNYTVDAVYNGRDALDYALTGDYDGIILDPPAYGHGPDGEKWKLDELLFGLLQNVAEILGERDSFMVLNLYSNGYSAALGETVVREAFKGQLKEMTSGELALNDSFGKVLPLSIYVRAKR